MQNMDWIQKRLLRLLRHWSKTLVLKKEGPSSIRAGAFFIEKNYGHFAFRLL